MKTILRAATLIAFGGIATVGTVAAQTGIDLELPPGVTPEMVARGRTVFMGPGGCHNCHGEDATGLLGPNLTDSDWWHVKGSYLSIVRQVMDGVPAEESVSGTVMAPRAGTDISDSDVQAVAAYVWVLSHPHAEDSLPAGVTGSMVDKGRVVFRGVGGCVKCHGADAHGDVGPDLTDEDWLHAKGSYLAIVNRILTGVSFEESKTGVVMPPRGGTNVSDADVYAVAAYIWAISRLNR